MEPSAMVAAWCQQLPAPFVRQLAAAVRTGPEACDQLAKDTSGPASVNAAHRARELARGGDGPYLAGLIDGWLAASRDAVDIQPVWTGPGSNAGGSRLTIAVINDLIAEASSEVLLVSYAAYPPLALNDSLLAATARGVRVTMLLERPEDNVGWSGPEDPFSDLSITQLHWPAGARPPGASMHAKLLVVDRRVALVGSANLTAAAFGRNLECGLLVRGGSVPAHIAEHILTADGLKRL